MSDDEDKFPCDDCGEYTESFQSDVCPKCGTLLCENCMALHDYDEERP